ncbi:MAG TPA: TOBE domain-containing protein [Candidatus Dormibacteraeota bacterium]
MPAYRVAEVADLLGVSDDTVRRWVDGGRLPGQTRSGRLSVDGAALAAFAAQHTSDPHVGSIASASARNRLRGLVTRVRRDGVMAQVELQCGRFRLVSLMSREAADELGLEPGVMAVASVKATNVVVELPTRS